MGVMNVLSSFVRTFNIFDFLDIVIVAFLIYHLIKIIRESRAGQLVKGIIIILCAYFLACQLNFRMLGAILSNFFQFSVFGLLVVFQPELRRILEQLGRSKIARWGPLGNMVSEEESCGKKYKEIVNITAESVLSLSDERMGALIVFERETRLGDVIDTGTILNAVPSVPLICNIFYTKSPLHDGALIIRKGVLCAGGCILPLTRNQNVSRELGTRHRAAIGMSENSDAVVVVVSEETGRISIVVNGVIKSYTDIDLFKRNLEKYLLNQPKNGKYHKVLSSFRKERNNG